MNIGAGQDMTIRELVETVMGMEWFEGQIMFDKDKPDGKMLDVGRLNAQNWETSRSLAVGITDTYKDCRSTVL